MESTIATKPTAQIEYPVLSVRILSTFIDAIFIVALMFVFASLLDKYSNPPDWIRVVLFFGLWVIYEPLCTSLGFTIGNLINGIRVRRYSDINKRISIFQALIRYVVKISLGWMSFLTIHTNDQRRAIHDFAAGSVMIKK